MGNRGRPKGLKMKCEICGYKHRLRIWDEGVDGKNPARLGHKWTICAECYSNKIAEAA